MFENVFRRSTVRAIDPQNWHSSSCGQRSTDIDEVTIPVLRFLVLAISGSADFVRDGRSAAKSFSESPNYKVKR